MAATVQSFNFHGSKLNAEKASSQVFSLAQGVQLKCTAATIIAPDEKKYPANFYELNYKQGMIFTLKMTHAGSTEPGELLIGFSHNKKIVTLCHVMKTKGYDFTPVENSIPLELKFAVFATDPSYNAAPLFWKLHCPLQHLNCYLDEQWSFPPSRQMYKFSTEDGLMPMTSLATTASAASIEEEDEMAKIMAELRAEEERAQQQKKHDEKQKTLLNAYPASTVVPATSAATSATKAACVSK